MSPAPPKQNVVDMLSWKVNSIDTKTRINEQNILNERRHVQLINKNLLSLKKEVRDRISEMSRQNAELKKNMDELLEKMEKFEANVKAAPRKPQKKKPKPKLLSTNMTSGDADSVLDNLIKGTGGN